MASHKSAEVHSREDRGGYHGQSQDYNLVEKNATTADVQDMQRMGIWGYLIVMIGFGFVVASLAEMASM